MKYFVMEGEGVYPVHPIRIEPDLPGGPWYHGQKLRISVPVPLEYELAKNYGANCKVKAMYGSKAIPVMHNTLVNVLLSAGVNNLELFPARILNPVTGAVHEDYQAFNVVGLVAAADLESSTLMDPDAEPSVLDTDFESLVIDEQKAHGFHLFRLAENCGAICVSEQVKKAVEKSGIPGIIFYGPGEWSG
ncbi:MAG TPA: DUF1629 domain-containing protein [Cellvibrio sp.]|nr:DUF1629 domain-containing protein [Cellvibrio sp.]